ncbi:hypothetical protein EDD18DRAFT_1128952 [Armillaria luteobubalina]|uniref:Uncharacterized protein n=1 Tax=Armillaria luteobubalina TaxID=153913 RepID=A0AA39UVP1_9AGAR|nr:hypothetical protein EDD18DRAFT_1128952 [Armillaria luteobubalina]
MDKREQRLSLAFSGSLFLFAHAKLARPFLLVRRPSALLPSRLEVYLLCTPLQPSVMFPRSTTPESESRRDPPNRTRLQGGFIMDSDTANEWASGIANEQFTMERINKVCQIIERKVKPYGSRFSFVGENLYAEFMVVTQRAIFRKGYLGKDPRRNSPRVAKELLEKEGLGHLKFATRLD